MQFFGNASAEEGPTEVWIDLNRFVVVLYSLFEMIKLKTGVATIEQSLSKLRVQGDGACVIVDGPLIIAELAFRDATVVIRPCLVWPG